MDNKKNRLLGNAGAVAVAIVISLVMGEVALRVLSFSYHLYPERIEFGWPDPVTLEDKFRADRDLLWVPNEYDDKLAGAREARPPLIFMGDSCTQYGRYDTYVAALFEEEHGGALSYLNLGVGGWSSYQGLEQLRRDIAPLAPRVVTIYFGWNDHWMGFGVADKDVARVSRSPLRKVEGLRLVQLVNKVRVVVMHRQRDDHPLRRVSPEDFRDNLEHMIALARDNDIVPVLITAPTSHQAGKEPKELEERFVPDLAELVPLHRQYTDIVREVAGEHDVVLADLAAQFDALPRDLVVYSYFMQDGIHLRDSGNRKIAEFLYSCLKENGLLAPPR